LNKRASNLPNYYRGIGPDCAKSALTHAYFLIFLRIPCLF